MKSKKLLVFLIMFIFIAVLVILNSTLFTLQKINLTWLTNTVNLKTLKESDIVSLVEEKGDSIFLLKKDEISARLEKKHPYLRVVGIETKFPNKIIVYGAERDDLYAVKLADGDYALVDDYGKVLSVTQVISPNVSGSLIEPRPIEVEFNSSSAFTRQNFVVGEDIKIESVKSVLTKLSYTLKEANYTNLAKKGIFSKITISDMGEEVGKVSIVLKTRNGMEINLLNAEDKMTDKFLLGLQVYNRYHQESYSEGKIVVLYSLDKEKIVAYFNDMELDSNK